MERSVSRTGDLDPSNEESWGPAVRGLIRVEMFRRGLNFAALSRALQNVGVTENERNLRNKVARGTFSAVFLVQCMVAMGVESIPLDANLYPGSHRPRPPRPLPKGATVKVVDVDAAADAHPDATGLGEE
jgi:hypothetical protein